MGQTYCETCCGGSRDLNTNLTEVKPTQVDAPNPKFAKPVKSFIQVHPRVREIFVRERQPHIPERTGTSLCLHYLFEYAAYYEGNWKNGLPHGPGRLIYDDGSIYEGCFKEGFAECRKALFIKENGSFYKGQVRMNKAFGEGVLTTEKVTYNGNWSNDLPHGQGKEIYNRSSLYMGSFDKGVKSGNGRYQWNSFEYYEGEFKNNEINGWGKHVTREYEYEGQFQKGQKHGRGTLTNTIKGEIYKGDFRHNKMEGQGIYIWPDETRFEGKFVNNQKKQGRLILGNGEVIEDYTA